MKRSITLYYGPSLSPHSFFLLVISLLVQSTLSWLFLILLHLPCFFMILSDVYSSLWFVSTLHIFAILILSLLFVCSFHVCSVHPPSNLSWAVEHVFNSCMSYIGVLWMICWHFGYSSFNFLLFQLFPYRLTLCFSRLHYTWKTTTLQTSILGFSKYSLMLLRPETIPLYLFFCKSPLTLSKFTWSLSAKV